MECILTSFFCEFGGFLEAQIHQKTIKTNQQINLKNNLKIITILLQQDPQNGAKRDPLESNLTL